ncbi:hypothetical protein LPJ57_004293 [Coemansia sp. RSA 486]|nr:hypothetical protein LPJ57_004293 [Coemansia sp. RSA 486]
MIVYILAIPLFSFLIPIYSFWHFDDFSWGNTRVVIGESGRKHVYTVDNEKFDKSSVPVRKWSDYEQELLEDPRSQYAASETGSRFGGPAAAINRPGSAIGNVPQSMVGYAGTNSVYYDGGYGYNTMLNSNLPMNSTPGIPGATLDFMASGRSSPVQPMLGGAATPNAYEMATMNSAMGGPLNQVRVSTVGSVMDPRMSQAGGVSYFQQNMAMPDPRLSTAYSVGQPVNMSPAMVPQQGIAMSSPSRPMSYAVGNDQMAAPVGMMDARASQASDYSVVPVPPAGMPTAQLQQWPSGATDEQLSQHVADIIATTDLMTITKKQVRQQVMIQFGLSADEEKARREFINQCIARELEKRQSGN